MCLYAPHIVRGVTRGEGGHNSSGAESLWERRMTAGGAEKSQQCHKYFFQYSCFRKTSNSNMGAPNLLLAPTPSNLVTPLHSVRVCMLHIVYVFVCFT